MDSMDRLTPPGLERSRWQIEAGDAFLAVLWQNNVGIAYTPRKLYGRLLVRGRGKAEEQLYGRDHHRCTRGTR